MNIENGSQNAKMADFYCYDSDSIQTDKYELNQVSFNPKVY